MKKMMTAIALLTLLGATPAAIAKDKTLKNKESQQSSVQENANRVQNADGTFQGKPVVKGPANWHHANASANTGASSGESGSSAVGTR